MDGNQQQRIDGPAEMRPTTEHEVYRYLLEMSHSPLYDLNEVAHKVNAHPSVARRLLRVANASSQGLTHRIFTVRHALIMLGAAGLATFSRESADFAPANAAQVAVDPTHKNVANSTTAKADSVPNTRIDQPSQPRPFVTDRVTPPANQVHQP